MKKSLFATPVERIFVENQSLRHQCIGFATPVHRILVQNQHLRHLCIGFLLKMTRIHAKVTVCDAC